MENKWELGLHNYIYKYGEKRDKKHGNWIKLHLFDNWFLQMDTWNS